MVLYFVPENIGFGLWFSTNLLFLAEQKQNSYIFNFSTTHQNYYNPSNLKNGLHNVIVLSLL